MDIIEIYSIKSEGKNYGIYENLDDALNKVKKLHKRLPDQKFEIVARKTINISFAEKTLYNLPYE